MRRASDPINLKQLPPTAGQFARRLNMGHLAMNEHYCSCTIEKNHNLSGKRLGAPALATLYCSKALLSPAAKRFLCAAPAFMAGCAGVLASSAVVRKNPQPFQRLVFADCPDFEKSPRTLSTAAPSLSANHRA
jgi:hypothetical protein